MKQDIRKKVLEKGEIIPLNFDYMFTAIFNNPENIKILESFLASYFHVPFSTLRGKVKILSRALSLESKNARNKQVDLVLNLHGEKINIELSNYCSKGVIKRNVVYACNVHGRQLKYGDNNYSHIKRTIQINLNSYSIFQDAKHYKQEYVLREKVSGKILVENFQIDMIDMVKAREMCYNDSSDELAKWCKIFLSTTEEELKSSLEEVMMNMEEKEKLLEEVEKLSTDEEVIALYSKYTKEELERNTYIDEALEEGIKDGIERGLKQGIEQGLQQGIEQGLQQGIEQGLQQGIEQGLQQGIEQGKNEGVTSIAKTMLKAGEPFEKINAYTNLSYEQLEQMDEK